MLLTFRPDCRREWMLNRWRFFICKSLQVSPQDSRIFKNADEATEVLYLRISFQTKVLSQAFQYLSYCHVYCYCYCVQRIPIHSSITLPFAFALISQSYKVSSRKFSETTSLTKLSLWKNIAFAIIFFSYFLKNPSDWNRIRANREY